MRRYAYGASTYAMFSAGGQHLREELLRLNDNNINTTNNNTNTNDTMNNVIVINNIVMIFEKDQGLDAYYYSLCRAVDRRIKD